MESTKKSVATVPELESHLGYLLRRVSNAVSGAFSRALQERETSVAEWVLLRELSERGQTQPSDLAEILGLTRGAISKVVDKLEAKNWVQMEANQADSRFRLLSPTKAGRRSLPILTGLADQNEERFFKCLSAEEQSTLRELLVKLAQQNHIHDVPTD